MIHGLTGLLGQSNGKTIPPEDITVGTFKCTDHWGMTEHMVCREAVYIDHERQLAQQGVLIFEPGISKYLIKGREYPWTTISVLHAGPDLTCSFSLASHLMRLDPEFTDVIGHRHLLPCAVVHDFEDMSEKSKFERLFNI